MRIDLKIALDYCIGVYLSVSASMVIFLCVSLNPLEVHVDLYGYDTR